MEAVSQFEMFIPLYQNTRRHRKKWGYRNLGKEYLHTNKTQTKGSIRNRVPNATVMLVEMLLAQYSK
jgi:hypothetical protein